MAFKNKSVGKAHSVTRFYIAGLKDRGPELAALNDNYKGTLLVEHTNKLQATYAEQKARALQEIETVKAELIAALDSNKGLDAAKLTPDYELLRLPVILTGDEILELNRRNPNDVLFTRALRQYAKQHGIEADITDTYANRRAAIDELINHTAAIIKNDDAETFRDLDTMGAYERLDDRITV